MVREQLQLMHVTVLLVEESPQFNCGLERLRGEDGQGHLNLTKRNEFFLCSRAAVGKSFFPILLSTAARTGKF